MNPPRVFISYSWTTPEHEEFVLQLATQLRENGADAVLDKWDLKEGHEASAFMEQMVSDPDVQKVIIVSDRRYVEKSNARSGGAGAEAQIISKEIFNAQQQSKFVALVTELNEDGSPCVPAYYTSRIFIDHSDVARETDAFEQLLRWIFDKPVHRKPEIGRQPAFICQPEGSITLPTSSAAKRAVDALNNGKSHSLSATIDYFDLFTSELERLRFEKDFDPLGDDVLVNLESFVPFRDESLEVIRAIARATSEDSYGDAIHRFLEGFIPYLEFHGSGSYRDIDFDNFRFFAHEMALHICAILIEENRSDLFSLIVTKPYFDPHRADRGGGSVRDFTVFRAHLKLLQHRNQALKTNRLSLHADMLKQRSPEIGRRFDKLMQADLILFLRFKRAEGHFSGWWPESLLYASHYYGTFEAFARAKSKREFSRLLPFLGFESKDQFDEVMQDLANDRNLVPSWQFDRPDLQQLTGHEDIATSP